MDGEIFESGKQTLRIQHYPDIRERGIKLFPEALCWGLLFWAEF